MKIYCYGCKMELDVLDRCPKCETRGDIGFEESRDWHWLCRLWANKQGWVGDTISIPLWFERNPEQLPQWQAFKTKLLDVDALPLPAHLKGRFNETFEYWINSSGILPMQQGTLNDLIITPPIGPLVHKLATAYAEHQREREEAEQKEQEENSKDRKKKTLIQRVRRKTL